MAASGKMMARDSQGKVTFFKKGAFIRMLTSMNFKKSLKDEKFKAHFARTSVIQMFFI